MVKIHTPGCQSLHSLSLALKKAIEVRKFLESVEGKNLIFHDSIFCLVYTLNSVYNDVFICIL